MTDETELVKAARKLVEFANTTYVNSFTEAELVRKIQTLENHLPPKPVTHRCIRPGCDGVPEFISTNSTGDGYIRCVCGLRSHEYSSRERAHKAWYKNNTGLPDD